MLVSFDTLNTFWENKREVELQEGSRQSIIKYVSSESSVYKVMETIMIDDNEPSTQDPISNVTDEDGLMELFDQFSKFCWWRNKVIRKWRFHI